MRRKWHRRHDREILRSLFVTAAFLLTAAVGVFFGTWQPVYWLIGVAAAVFLFGLWYGLRHGRRMNACGCPGCGRSLSREPDTTEFFCEKCSIIWWTTFYGSSIVSWGRTPPKD